MELSQPFSGMFFDIGGSSADLIRVVGFQKPFDLSKLAFVKELMRQVLGFNLVVKLRVVLRRNKVKEELTNLLMNRMILQQFKIGNVTAGLFS